MLGFLEVRSRWLSGMSLAFGVLALLPAADLVVVAVSGSSLFQQADPTASAPLVLRAMENHTTFVLALPASLSPEGVSRV